MVRVKKDNVPEGFREATPFCQSLIEAGLRHFTNQLGSAVSPQFTNPNPNFDEPALDRCTEDQLEEVLLKRLESSYNEAIKNLVSVGYSEDLVMKAILTHGNCYGPNDAHSNIVNNTLNYLTSGDSSSGSDNSTEVNTEKDESITEFVDLKQLGECSLDGMIQLLRNRKPNLSKGDAMLYLLMTNLHVGRASSIEIPPSPSNVFGTSKDASGNSNNESGGSKSTSDNSNAESSNVPLPLCKYHRGCGFEQQRETICPSRFNLTPSMKDLLKRNVAMFAAGFRASKRESDGNMGKNEEQPKKLVNQELVNTVLSKFRDMNLDGKNEDLLGDQKGDMIHRLYHQIKELEIQVKERKEWAHKKALQAASKLSQDLTELKTLRMEKDEIRLPEKVDPDPSDSNMLKLKELENSVKMANVHLERAMSRKKELENDNKEIRAELEAFKLNASESWNICLEISKREKKCLKRLLAWEKQRGKLKEDIAEEKLRISGLNKDADQVEADKKAAEAKWRQLQKAKEVAQEQVNEERRLKEAEEANSKRRMECLRVKADLDFKRHNDDMQRLEQEIARLKDPSENIKGAVFAEDDFNRVESYNNRPCLVCKKEVVSVVFLPCAHQVVCGKCDAGIGNKRGKVLCPFCKVPVEKRVRVFGASS